MTAPIPPRDVPAPPSAEAADLLARVLHRDASVLVLDKPAGMPVHRGPRAADGGAVPLDAYLDELRFGLPRRPELAHRLDRDTSGCLVLGRHRRALAGLGKLFAAGEVEKRYWAVVEGGPGEDAGEIDLALTRRDASRGWWMKVDPAGQPSLTRWRVLGRGEGAAFLELEPVTGRTHQLRVHCAAAGWPIRGDAVYGGAPRFTGPGLHLHARQVELTLERRPVRAVAPAPERMRAALAACGWSGEGAEAGGP